MIFCITIFFLFISCNKQESTVSGQIEKRITKPVNPTSVASKRKTGYKSIKEIISTLDKAKLSKFKNIHRGRMEEPVEYTPEDVILQESEAQQILQPVNANILTYLSETYPQLGSTSMIDVNDPDFTYFVQVYSIAEQSGFIVPANATGLTPASREIPTWLRCTVDIVIGYFDIVSLIQGLGTFEFGSVWTVVKSAVKKYLGWVGAAILMYDIATECL